MCDGSMALINAIVTTLFKESLERCFEGVGTSRKAGDSRCSSPNPFLIYAQPFHENGKETSHPNG